MSIRVLMMRREKQEYIEKAYVMYAEGNAIQQEVFCGDIKIIDFFSIFFCQKITFGTIFVDK